eukprot:TRINITY_DN6162_c0_g1_i1.p1 TRINITY_DN6162_c0_g1~~TRINITY_DN6162_c0_g1_i1.p1  ORF type:complete len:276 (+),score=47.73 TRINITY_DN6162_c0_g1_i1:102-929(+)
MALASILRIFCTGSATNPREYESEVMRAAVVLNVYDESPCVNWLLCRVGLGGIYHSGVEIGNVEYAYGGGPGDQTGVWRQFPRQPPVGYARLKASVPMGFTVIPQQRFDQMLARLERVYTRSSYDVVSRNCHHFASALCMRLVGRSVPDWVTDVVHQWQSFAELLVRCPCGPAHYVSPPESLWPVPIQDERSFLADAWNRHHTGGPDAQGTYGSTGVYHYQGTPATTALGGPAAGPAASRRPSAASVLPPPVASRPPPPAGAPPGAPARACLPPR